MKLSEKLAQLEEEEKASAEQSPWPQSLSQRGVRTSGSAKPTSSNWEATKRKVRELVLDEVAPVMHGLSAGEVAGEVRSALDRILQREDVTVSPLERRKFVAETISDTLGYGPLDPLLADESITEIMGNRLDDIWVEREGEIEHTDLVFSGEAQNRQVVEKIGSARRRIVAHGGCPSASNAPSKSCANTSTPRSPTSSPVR